MKTLLVAHRGEPDSWPENSLAGFRAALAAGAQYLETDIQLTADRVAILSHDPTLLRLTGQDLEVTRTDWAQIANLPAGEPERFGAAFSELHIARLDDFAALLKQWPRARAFVEIKTDSLQVFGADTVLDSVLDCLTSVLDQCILISFDDAVLARARRRSPVEIGWVLSEWSDKTAATATGLAPDYLFCNRKRLPPAPDPLWAGPWQWVIYTVDAASELAPLFARGIRLVETNGISRLLADLASAGTACG
jgi:glycerophosphoryl diester phosphodiesterase